MRADLIIVDIDGVLIDSPHLSAWDEALRAIMRRHGIGQENSTAFLTARDYQARIAGKPREQGARAALELVGITHNERLTSELTKLKQSMFVALRHETRLFDDAARFLATCAAMSAPIGFCTASRNAAELLLHACRGTPHTAWVAEKLERSLGPEGHCADCDRETALRRIAAAWGAQPSNTAVIDDAIHGVDAAAACGMGGILVDRSDRHDWPNCETRRVVHSLDDVAEIVLLRAGAIGRRLRHSAWPAAF